MRTSLQIGTQMKFLLLPTVFLASCLAMTSGALNSTPKQKENHQEVMEGLPDSQLEYRVYAKHGALVPLSNVAVNQNLFDDKRFIVMGIEHFDENLFQSQVINVPGSEGYGIFFDTRNVKIGTVRSQRAKLFEWPNFDVYDAQLNKLPVKQFKKKIGSIRAVFFTNKKPAASDVERLGKETMIIVPNN